MALPTAGVVRPNGPWRMMRHRHTKRKKDIHWLALISGVLTAGLDDDDDEDEPPLLLLLLALGSLDEELDDPLALGSARGSLDDDDDAEPLARGSLDEDELLARGSLDELEDPEDPERCAAAAAAARGSLRGSGGMVSENQDERVAGQKSQGCEWR